MKRLWFVTNQASGSVTLTMIDAIEADLAGRGCQVIGRTRFPADALPDQAALTAAGIDTLMLLAGDGTINAALSLLGSWQGAVLILPGGTMNLLAKALHGARSAVEIAAAAQASPRLTDVPFVQAGPHRAYVGMIVGPGARWAHAREAVRRRQPGRVARAARLAWRRTFGAGVRLSGDAALRGRYQAVFISPDGDGLGIAAINARDWVGIADLGWAFLTGEWVQARSIAMARACRVAIAGAKPTPGLIDGEPIMLAPETPITAGRTAGMFITTL